MRKSDLHDLESPTAELLNPGKNTQAEEETQSSTKETKANAAVWAGILSCLMYSFVSCAMVLSNKAISTSLAPEDRKHLPQLSVILFQCLVAVVLVEAAKVMKMVDYPTFNLATAKSWLPLNILFIGMLVTGFLSLVYVSVPMVTVFKNLTNLITVSGDVYFFGETYVVSLVVVLPPSARHRVQPTSTSFPPSRPSVGSVSYLTVASIVLMTIGAILAGANDLEFHALGYFWMILNCLCTAGYVLYMRFASTNIKLPRYAARFW